MRIVDDDLFNPSSERTFDRSIDLPCQPGTRPFVLDRRSGRRAVLGRRDLHPTGYAADSFHVSRDENLHLTPLSKKLRVKIEIVCHLSLELYMNEPSSLK